jgi:hypothetical protein
VGRGADLAGELLVIVLMVVVFVLALLLPFPAGRDERADRRTPMSSGEPTRSGSWTVWLRTRLSRTVPAGQLLPDRQPA